MLFSPLIFVFPHWQYDNLDNRSFFFLFSLGCVWIVCECTRPAGNTRQQSRPRWPLSWRHHPGYQRWQHRAHDAHGGTKQDQNLHSAAHPHRHQVGNTIYTPLFNARQFNKHLASLAVLTLSLTIWKILLSPLLNHFISNCWRVCLVWHGGVIRHIYVAEIIESVHASLVCKASMCILTFTNRL